MDVTIINQQLRVNTNGDCQIVDVTPDLASLMRKNKLQDGHILVFVPGSTAGLTTIEFEPGLLKDVPLAMERIAPQNIRYHHNDTWGDGNGHSHVRASLVGPSLTIPVVDAEMTLGTWQQVVLIDFDNRPRQRKLVVQLYGHVREPG